MLMFKITLVLDKEYLKAFVVVYVDIHNCIIRMVETILIGWLVGWLISWLTDWLVG